MGSHPKPTPCQRVGVLFTSDPTSPTETVQLLDTAAADLFSFMNPEFLRLANYPEDVAAKGCDYETLYIAEKEHGKTVKLSNGLECTVTHTLEAAHDKHLDILFVPGPITMDNFSDALKAFIRKKYAEVHTVISVCTGIFSLAHSGVLDGHRVTATRMFLPKLRKEFPKIEVTEKRWEIDDRKRGKGPELWTAGGVANGIDTVNAYLKSKFPPEVTKILSDIVEVAERSEEYK